ncbi:hypothetical protein SKUN_00327 [Spiroplasma kunkelii CR2-3x]|uniref:Uncharacterized protein n=1 Tax=Spiroplasma kunkelii CR2-3x TaxID=273035 RepID=A0A0K2JFA0_SPIKU|nr:hypothetical protein SKUN_00327 [Spiroplasma kunkelii CR2-3x]
MEILNNKFNSKLISKDYYCENWFPLIHCVICQKHYKNETNCFSCIDYLMCSGCCLFPKYH